jgi:3-phenylpropionate/cinnamic acid dioxygenase small subunit
MAETDGARRGYFVVTISRSDAEQLLFEEAHMLDEGLFDNWLGLFAPGGMYWLPMVDNSDPDREPSLIYDNATGREQRVFAIRHRAHYAQHPPSRTVRTVSNVRVDSSSDEKFALVRSNLLVLEFRPGDRQQVGLAVPRLIGARCEYRLQRDAEWKIALKKVLLIDRDVPILNLSFIV